MDFSFWWFIPLGILAILFVLAIVAKSSSVDVPEQIRIHFLEKHGVTLDEKISYQRSFGHYDVYFLWNNGRIVTWDNEKNCLINCPICKLECSLGKIDNLIEKLNDIPDDVGGVEK